MNKIYYIVFNTLFCYICEIKVPPNKGILVI